MTAHDDLAAALARATDLLHEIATETRGPDEAGAFELLNPNDVAERLAASVIRPLRETLTAVGEPSSPQVGDEADAVGAAGPEPVGGLDESLWQLTMLVTSLAAHPDAPSSVVEAAAALQDLAARDPGRWPDRLTALRALQPQGAPMIEASLNGPYLVTNATAITDWLGQEMSARPQMALCRCGASTIKPLCDGSHAANGFRGAKDPNRVADRRDTYVGQQVTILDNRGTCQHAGYCTDRLASVFRLREEPFVKPSGGRMDEIIRAVRDCPSGALSYAIDGREAREQVDQGKNREPSIEVTKDGPYRITGGVALHGADGAPEARNAGASLEHYALCRCGHSQNKPFCSGMHWNIVDFHDPVPDPDHVPTIFEWAGGLPALTRMTRLFYEKYVPQDPLLAPLFADMSVDHPQRVAKWLSEVFCGPSVYSEAYGGYTRMISQHIGKGLTEEQRARWAALLYESANDAGLPNDAEFRSVFASYIEWGSRLAVENSTSGARPPEHMPMPHWDWRTASGPPTGRVSALASLGTEDDPPIELPAGNEPVGFEKHIKPLFRSRDRQSMAFAFDLWAYADVTSHAGAILEQLQSGSMPCDGAWPANRIEVFQRWMDSDMSA